MEYLIEAVGNGIRKLLRWPERKQLPWLISTLLLSAGLAYLIMRIGALVATISAHAESAERLSELQNEADRRLAVAVILPFVAALALAFCPSFLSDIGQSRSQGENRRSLVLFLKRYTLALIAVVMMTTSIIGCFLVVGYALS